MGDSSRTNRRHVPAISILTAALIASAIAFAAAPVEAHTIGRVPLYPPLSDGDSDHRDPAGKWATTAGTEPARHDISYRGYGYGSDWAVDIFAPAGRQVVTPFASRTTDGDRVISRVIEVRPGCATRRIEDGGYLVQVEAVNARTGRSLGIASLMHVDRPQVRKGQELGGWTTIGYTATFDLGRSSSCYQVTTPGGVHIHFEIVAPTDYACYVDRPRGANLTELTKIGETGSHYRSRRARC